MNQTDKQSTDKSIATSIAALYCIIKKKKKKKTTRQQKLYYSSLFFWDVIKLYFYIENYY